MSGGISAICDHEELEAGATVLDIPSSSRWATAISLLILLVLPYLVFSQVRNSDFIGYDDPDYVLLEPLVVNGVSWSGLYQSLTTYRNANWHPVTWWSLMLDRTAFGPNATAFHLHNLVLHILNGMLLFLWLRQCIFSTIPSLLVAVLFSIHPLHVEPVAWVSSRKDVLSTFFLLCTLMLHVRYAHKPRMSVYLGMSAFLALGLMAKSMLVTTPILLLLIDVCLLRRLAGGWSIVPMSKATTTAGMSQAIQGCPPDCPTRSWIVLLCEKLPLLALSGGTSYLCYRAQQGFGAVVDVGHSPVLERMFHVLTSYSFYIKKTFFPFNLTLHYPYVPEQMTWTSGVVATSILIAATWFALRPGRAQMVRSFGWGWYVVSLLPVCGIVRLGGLAAADRYSYVPLIGLFVVIVAVLPLTPIDLPSIRRTTGVLSVVVCSVLAMLAFRQVSYWHDSETIFQHAVEITPNSARIHGQLGHALERRGKLAEATEHLLAAVRLYPDDVGSRCLLCRILTAERDYSGAIAIIAEAASVDRRIMMHGKVRLVTNGERRSRAAIHHLWGRALSASGSHQEALAKFNEAISIEESIPRFHADRAEALKAIGQYEAAAADYRRCIELDRRNWRWQQKLAHLLATCLDPSVRDAAEALRIAEQANELNTRPRSECVDTLACAFAANGDFDSAIHVIKSAIEAGADRTELGAQLEEHLMLFEQGLAVMLPATVTSSGDK